MWFGKIFFVNHLHLHSLHEFTMFCLSPLFLWKKSPGLTFSQAVLFQVSVPFPDSSPNPSPRILPHAMERKNQKIEHFPSSVTIQRTECLLSVKWKRVNDICLLIKADSWSWIYPQDFIIIEAARRSGINRLIRNHTKKVLIRERVILPSHQFGKKKVNDMEMNCQQ